jgi:hypothetical protein
MFKWYMRLTDVNPFHILTDGTNDGGAGGGAPAPTPAPAGSPAPGGGTPTPSPSPSPSPTPGPGAPAPGGANPAGGAGAPNSQYTYPEDRSTWIPKSRFDEAVARERQEVERIRQVALGITPREPQDPRRAEAREALLEVFPELRQMIDQMPQLATSQQRAEARVVNQTLSTIYSEAATILGVEKVNPFQESVLAQSFLGYLQATPEMARRFDMGDPRVVQEFLSEYRKNFLDPARRSGQAPNAPQGGNRPPIGGNRGNLPPSPQPSGVIPGGGGNGQQPTGDQRLSGAFAALRQQMANRNG